MTEKRDKTLVEQAMDEIQLIRESMKDNTKDILRSVAVEEIGGIVQESLNEDFEDEDEDSEIGMDTESGEEDTEIEVDTPSEEDSEEIAVSDESDDEIEIDSDDMSTDGLGDTESSEADYETEEDTDLEYDYTSASDDEVIAVFKKLRDSDEIEIVDDNEVHITDPESGSEYQVKLKGNESSEDVVAPVGDVSPEIGVEDEYTDSESDEDDTEAEYEISLGDDDEDDEEVKENVAEDIVRGQGHDTYASGGKLPDGNIEGQTAEEDPESGDNLEGGFDDKAVSHAKAEGPMVMEDEEEEVAEEVNEDEVEESIAVGTAQAQRVPAKADNGAPKGPGADALSESKEYQKLKENYNKILKETEGFKTALKQLRTMLGEAATYNSNLTYATRLFTEHSTTKEEKRKILEKFDNEAKTLKESKKVYKSLLEDFSSKPKTQDSVNKKY